MSPWQLTIFNIYSALYWRGALVKTLTKVLKKKPGAREGSDGLLVQQFEESVDKYIKAKEEQLGTFETTGRYAALKESINAADAAQEELEDALENQRKNLQEGLAAKKKQERMAASLSQKHEAVKERIEDEKQAAASIGISIGIQRKQQTTKCRNLGVSSSPRTPARPPLFVEVPLVRIE
jgi:chromosome segregation ATPase